MAVLGSWRSPCCGDDFLLVLGGRDQRPVWNSDLLLLWGAKNHLVVVRCRTQNVVLAFSDSSSLSTSNIWNIDFRVIWKPRVSLDCSCIGQGKKRTCIYRRSSNRRSTSNVDLWGGEENQDDRVCYLLRSTFTPTSCWGGCFARAHHAVSAVVRGERKEACAPAVFLVCLHPRLAAVRKSSGVVPASSEIPLV